MDAVDWELTMENEQRARRKADRLEQRLAALEERLERQERELLGLRERLGLVGETAALLETDTAVYAGRMA